MTNSPQQQGDQPTPDGAYPAYPGAPAPYSTPPRRGGKTGLIIAGVIGLVAGIGIGVGGFALATNDDDPEPRSDGPPASRVPITTPSDWNTTTTSAPAQPADGAYTMSEVGNACDLVDPTRLYGWAGSTPKDAPYHREAPPYELACSVSFLGFSADQTHYNEAGIEFNATFTEAGADPAYDGWKTDDTEATGAGLASGDVTGIGTKGYWHSNIPEPGTNGSYDGGDYIVGVQDDNVSIRVRIALLRQPGEPPVNWEDVSALARSQVQQSLNALRT